MAIFNIFGRPGSGKSTSLAYIADKYLKKGYTVFSNTRIKGTYFLDVDKLGLYNFDGNEKVCLVIDELGLNASSRNYANFSNKDRFFWKYHRHFGEVLIFYSSQGIDDVDLTIRSLVQRSYRVTNKSFPGFYRIYYNDDWYYNNPYTYESIKIKWLRNLLFNMKSKKINRFHNKPKLWTKIPFTYRFDLKKISKIRLNLIRTDTFIDNEAHTACTGYEEIKPTLINRILYKFIMPEAFITFKPDKYFSMFDSYSMPSLTPLKMDAWSDAVEQKALNDMLRRAVAEDNKKLYKNNPLKIVFADDDEVEVNEFIDNIKKLPPVEKKKWDDIPKTEQEIEYEIRNGIKYPKRKD